MENDTVIPMFAPDEAASGAMPEVKSEAEPPDPFRGREFLAHEFVLWLWFRTEHDFGAFNLPDGPIDLWFDDKLTFLGQEKSRQRLQWRSPFHDPRSEALHSLWQGHHRGAAGDAAGRE